MGKKKKIVIIVCSCMAAILTVGGVILGIYLADYNEYRDKVAGITIENIDISKLQDGIYTGSCDVGFIYAAVSVTVCDGKIVKLALLRHDNERGEDAESIIYDVMNNQSLNVDCIAGATNSSKTILKAIENALKSQPKPLD